MNNHLTETRNKTQPTALAGPVLLRRLDEIEGGDLPMVGGKAFRLALLRQHGLQAPDGLVLTTHFFEAQIRAARLTPLWAGSPDIAVTAEALQWLADALKTKPLARELMEALNQRLESTFGPEINSFAVRSSVIDEDHRDHTFAGVHLTELGVPRMMIPIAITRCWASALAEPAIQYRQRHGMSIQGIQVAVLIQPMVTPNSSGVGFTMNPLTGSGDELVIEAVWGLGSSLVAGEVQPYFYRLLAQPPDYPLIEQRQGQQTPPPGAGDEPLSPAERTALAHQLAQIQALLGEAQDVEWAWERDQLYILQSRPVAAQPEPPAADREWSRNYNRESLPELPSPFFGYLLERAQPQLVQFFKSLGFEVEALGPYEKLILGRPYVNISLFKRMMAQAGIYSASLLQSLGYAGQSKQSVSFDWKTAWQARRIYRRAWRRARQADYLVGQARRLAEETFDVLAVPPEPPEPEVIWLKQLRQQTTLYSELATAQLGLTLGIAALTSLGGRLIRPYSPTPLLTVSALASQGLVLAKDDFNQALLTLSRLASSQPESKHYLLDFSDDAERPAAPLEFSREIERLLGQYGERATYEADPGWPRYRDEPASLLKIIRQYIKNEAWQTASGRAAAASNDQGLAPWWSWRSWLLQPVVKELRHFLSLKDEVQRLQARAVAACRRWGLSLGQQWVEKGWLDQAEDIFWLTGQELERMFRVEAGIAPTLAAIVRARKETYRMYENTELPQNVKEPELASIQLGVGFADETAAPAVTVGLPISPGQARGSVVVVRHPDEFEQVAGDIILVMPSTDPAWLPLLRLACGLIVETGGLLSHGSVIAREYGLPAVANIPQATRRFQTGDKVLVDGSTGVVQLLEPAQPGPKQDQ
jgi:pyruvate,water dikinase